MYLQDKNKYTCSGCTACMSICPRNAIKMIEDEEGFRYPEIDEGKCVNCNLCVSVCPNIKECSENKILEVHGLKHRNIEERKTSRSGAAFIAISDYILKNGGAVYGAKLNEDFTVSHGRATTKEERDAFKGSKYVQSDMNGIINQVKQDLREGRMVLFSGTACQVAGVKAGIPENLQDNLFTCDLICYGVPSTRVYRDFLSYIEKVNNKKIKKFTFRDKKFGWHEHYETIVFEDGTEISTQYFKKLFFSQKILRPSCHNCNYAKPHRPADISIGDFWGIENVSKDFEDSLGVSVVIINNAKGEKMFKELEEVDIIDCPIEVCIANTWSLRGPTPESPDRNEFWNDYEKNDFEYIIKKYAN